VKLIGGRLLLLLLPPRASSIQLQEVSISLIPSGRVMTFVIRPSKPPTGRSAARKETAPRRAPRRRCRRPAGRRFVGTLTFKFLGGGGGGLRMQLASWRQFTTRQWPRARDCGTQARAFLMPAPPRPRPIRFETLRPS